MRKRTTYKTFYPQNIFSKITGKKKAENDSNVIVAKFKPCKTRTSQR